MKRPTRSTSKIEVLTSPDAPSPRTRRSAVRSPLPVRTIPLEKAMPKKTNQTSTKYTYPAQKEFEQLKQFRYAADFRIATQNKLLNQINRGKFKVKDVPKEMLTALAKHDIKLLEKSRDEFEQRTSQLREKIHQEILGDCRSNHFNY